MDKRTVVWIKWADAHAGDNGWMDLEEYEDDGEAIVDTVGFLVSVPDHGSKAGHVTVWQTLSDGDGIHPMHIPVGMVRSMVVLNPPH